MLELTERTIRQKDDGTWMVEQRMKPSTPLSSACVSRISGNCANLCAPIIVQWESDSAGLARARLYCEFSSEKEARSEGVATEFDHACKKLAEALTLASAGSAP